MKRFKTVVVNVEVTGVFAVLSSANADDKTVVPLAGAVPDVAMTTSAVVLLAPAGSCVSRTAKPSESWSAPATGRGQAEQSLCVP